MRYAVNDLLASYVSFRFNHESTYPAINVLTHCKCLYSNTHTHTHTLAHAHTQTPTVTVTHTHINACAHTFRNKYIL